ncbi:HIRA-interacting protein 3 isoform X2 [Cricetulus griseus]|nr:HIRA-interacting protein 3 isoform X2 [Cricetulus griseus]XP_027297730.1 HIRA-interacting protein 3 isoform X2 [Cricetulus griseus]
MQADAGTREGKLDFTKVKRSPAPCSDPERKRSRFNSESDSSSTSSSPDCSGPPRKNSTTKEKPCLKRALNKAVESKKEEQQTDLVVKMRLEESSDEEGEGSVRSNKVWEEEDTEEDDDVKKEQKGRSKKKAGAKNKQTPSRASDNQKQVSEESDSEEEAMQGRAKVRKSAGTKRHKESEDSEEETLAKKKEHREPRPRSNKGERMSYKQKNRVGRLTGGLGDSEEEKERGAVSSGDSSGTEDESSSKRKSQDKIQAENGRRPSASSEDGESSTQELTAAPGTAKTGTVGCVNSESDMEREVSDSRAGESTKEERKNRSSKKSSKKGKARSSSSDSSPEPTSQKVGSRHRREDHPAVVRLKRYIRACGAHRNYKKLLGSCRSHKECLSVLRAELEALGMKGNPSLEKCRALKEQREEAAEVASLDVANIISSSGRPRRRNAWNPSGEGIPPGELYRRALDSEEERPRQAPPDWSHMRGIISSDGESS